MSQQINLNLDKDQYNELKKILNNQYKTYDVDYYLYFIGSKTYILFIRFLDSRGYIVYTVDLYKLYS